MLLDLKAIWAPLVHKAYQAQQQLKATLGHRDPQVLRVCQASQVHQAQQPQAQLVLEGPQVLPGPKDPQV